MPNMSLKKNPMPEQDAVVRAGNFKEVALGYTPEIAADEALRCPARDGQMPEAEPVRQEPDKKPERKAAGGRRKTK